MGDNDKPDKTPKPRPLSPAPPPRRPLEPPRDIPPDHTPQPGD